jgi:hypothetical protein
MNKMGVVIDVGGRSISLKEPIGEGTFLGDPTLENRSSQYNLCRPKSLEQHRSQEGLIGCLPMS